MTGFSWALLLATADTLWVRFGVFGVALVVGSILITTGYHRVESDEVEESDGSNVAIRSLLGTNDTEMMRIKKGTSNARARLQMAVGAGIILLGILVLLVGN
jgi:hypothetical protein